MWRLVFVPLLALTAFGAGDSPDLEVVSQIKHEAENNSQVMEHLFQLVEVYGPRITNSKGFYDSAEWAKRQLQKWGLENAVLEPWGPFGHGWSREYFSAHLLSPGYEQLIGVPLGWSPSTDGRLTGQPVLAPLKRDGRPHRDEQAIDEFIAKWKGKLAGAMVMIADLKKVRPQSRAPLSRHSSSDLQEMTKARPASPPIDYLDPDLQVPEDPADRRAFFVKAPRWFFEHRTKERRRIQSKLNEFLVSEGVRLVIHPSSRGDGGTIFPPRSGNYHVDHTAPPPSIALTPEHYNRIYRLVDKGIGAEIEVEVRTTFYRDNLDSINVIAEIPGRSKPDEVVMLGGHLDSTAAALGATDNGSGCAVMMEAVRMLKVLDLPMDRTVRIALWGGEEQGLLGSEAYVKQHFADPATMQL
ncbi:MAG: M28 family peptidase, partial [Bryobacterales bacterium]|nr:M28 family peptidase [Bryobacterales bacterium]